MLEGFAMIGVSSLIVVGRVAVVAAARPSNRLGCYHSYDSNARTIFDYF